MNNVIYPDRFKNKNPKRGGLSQQRTLQMYTALLNMHQSLHTCVINHQHINQFLLQNPSGLNPQGTLNAASAINKNQSLVESIMECIGMVMNIMLEDSGSLPMDITYVSNANQPDLPHDQPPAD